MYAIGTKTLYLFLLCPYFRRFKRGYNSNQTIRKMLQPLIKAWLGSKSYEIKSGGLEVTAVMLL